MKKRIFECMAWVFLLLFLITYVFSWKEQTHQSQLTKMALELMQLSPFNQKYSFEIWDNFSRFILQGAHDEDFPVSEYPDFPNPLEADFYRYGLRFNVRANNHYRHALSGIGLTGSPFVGLDDEDLDALSWAKSNGSFREEEEFMNGEQWSSFDWTAKDLDNGNMSWQKAIDRYGYTYDEKALAYYTLGFILHLLQDMGCPEHVHDDPHGASGYTGFEMYVYKKWEFLKPKVKTLRPKKYNSIDDYFNNLAMIAYSIDRFQGGEPDIDPKSDLAKMFLVEKNIFPSKWKMKNPDGSKIIDKGYYTIPDAFFNPGYASDFEWNREEYMLLPLWHKGHDHGEFWPTSMEMYNVEGSQSQDEEGFYYIELSGDTPPMETRHLYPAAFLPTPLPQVKSQCKGWRIPKFNEKTHLYAIIGKKMFPYIVEHSSGLIQHYFDIVNHPPFVKTVMILQGGEYKYAATWEDEEKPLPNKEKMTYVKTRNLNRDTNKKFVPGKVTIAVIFSEPVHQPSLVVGGKRINKLASGAEDMSWSGSYVIPETGPVNENIRISIKAVDKNHHYRFTGGSLDRSPKTPAKRLAWSDEYRWQNYEAGEDLYHSINVQREKMDISRERVIVGTWDWYVGNTLFGHVVVNGGGSEGSMTSYDTNRKKINSGKWKFDETENIYILTWDKGNWVDRLSLSTNGMILSGGNNARTRIEGRIRIKK